MRSFNGAPGRVDNAQMTGQYDDRASTQPIRQPTIVDLTAGGPESQDREPPPKRPRLELPIASNTPDTGAAMSGEARNTPGSASSRPAVSWRGRPLWSFQAVISDIPGNDNRGDGAGTKLASIPPLPAQPWKTPPVVEPSGTAPIKSRESSPVGAVQTTPYRIETPAVAPLYKGNSRCPFGTVAGSGLTFAL
jgi:mediator of RNA polymerase II transcription subunit 12